MSGNHQPVNSTSDSSQETDRRVLLMVLIINVGQCVGGVGVGIWASSTALIAAALDNLADASVYAVSLYAVGRAAVIKVRAARRKRGLTALWRTAAVLTKIG